MTPLPPDILAVIDVARTDPRSSDEHQIEAALWDACLIRCGSQSEAHDMYDLILDHLDAEQEL